MFFYYFTSMVTPKRYAIYILFDQASNWLDFFVTIHSSFFRKSDDHFRKRKDWDAVKISKRFFPIRHSFTPEFIITQQCTYMVVTDKNNLMIGGRTNFHNIILILSSLVIFVSPPTIDLFKILFFVFQSNMNLAFVLYVQIFY